MLAHKTVPTARPLDSLRLLRLLRLPIDLSVFVCVWQTVLTL